MLTRRRSRHASRERGFTVVEMIVVVAITGLIGLALLQVISLGFRETPGSVNRTKFGSNVAVLINNYSDEVANAPQAAVVHATGAETCSATQFDGILIQKTVTPSAWIVYTASVVPDPSGWNRVTVSRVETGLPSRTVLVGYCDPASSAKVFAGDYQEPTLTVTMTLSPNPKHAEQTVTLLASRRDLLAPT
jgi:prepilin-type N-terminal cleavage/methylation domain-containing protein